MSSTNLIDKSLLNEVAMLCKRAGSEILRVYQRDVELEISTKQDNSPLTEADLASHKILVSELDCMLKDVPILSEEGTLPAFQERKHWQRYWLIDPLDGTKEFISGNGEFTVNVALIEGNVPVLGVVHVPVKDITYLGLKGVGAWKEDSSGRKAIATRKLSATPSDTPFCVVASRRHGADAVENLLAKLEVDFGTITSVSMGSSLKLCLVAEGQADLYPRLALTSEWDTAAAQAVVEAAGGLVFADTLKELRYNTKDDILNPHFYVVGDPSYAWNQLLL